MASLLRKYPHPGAGWPSVNQAGNEGIHPRELSFGHQSRAICFIAGAVAWDIFRSDILRRSGCARSRTAAIA